MAEGRSIWAYVGMGCLVLVVLGAIAVVGGGYWLYKAGKQLEREMRDPVARTDKALEILGAEALPEGYHAMLAMRIPLVGKMAILSDEAPDAEGRVDDLGRRGLIYLQFIPTGQDREALRDYFEGHNPDPDVLRDNQINIDVEEVIDRGVIRLEESTLMYVAQRGSVSSHGVRGEGITAVILVECPEDSRNRTAIWFGPDTDSEDAPLTGTPADPEAIRAFMGHFRLCGT